MAHARPSLVPFNLEDFFDRYEHRADLTNLASSDAQPWSTVDLQSKGIPPLASITSTLHYPDVSKHLYRSLENFCKPPAGTLLLPTAGASEAISLGNW
jgi:hypothetical protein